MDKDTYNYRLLLRHGWTFYANFPVLSGGLTVPELIVFLLSYLLLLPAALFSGLVLHIGFTWVAYLGLPVLILYSYKSYSPDGLKAHEFYWGIIKYWINKSSNGAAWYQDERVDFFNQRVSFSKFKVKNERV